ncbi:hypothetical protein D3C75_857790 [compost metagenome]
MNPQNIRIGNYIRVPLFYPLKRFSNQCECSLQPPFDLDGNIHYRERIGQRIIRYVDNCAIRDDMHLTSAAEQSCRSEANHLYRPLVGPGLNHISNGELILKNNKKACNYILDQTLCAKPDGKSNYPGACQ